MAGAPAEELLLFPCNGNAREAMDCLGSAFRPIGFIDDSPAKIGTTVMGLPVWSRRALADHPSARVLAVPGGPASFDQRAEVIASLAVPPSRFATVVHPAAAVSRHARLGRNVLVMAGVVITSNAVLEDHVVVLPNSVIHHDARVGAYTMVGSNVVISGSVVIDDRCYIGSGSRLRDHTHIPSATLVGMGATVVRSIPSPGGVWAGTPARLLRASVAAHRASAAEDRAAR